jgi:hypothetical protein
VADRAGARRQRHWGADSQEKYGSQEGVRFTPVSRARQKEAVAFLNDNAFATPDFFLRDDIMRRIEPTGSVARIVQAQQGILNQVLQNARLIRLSEYEHAANGAGYGMLEVLSDVRQGIFTELRSRQEIDVYRRALQRAYVENLNTKLNPPAPPPGAVNPFGGGAQNRGPVLDPKLSDLQAGVRAELKALDSEIKGAVPRTQGMTRAHLEDLIFRIDEALRTKPGATATTTT